ncbi:putative Coatomer subunit epsilon-1, partial [Cocos nucifera]
RLFSLGNSFYLKTYWDIINKSDISNLSPDGTVEHDFLVYRSYITLSSYQILVINEIDSSASTTLQAVKLLVFYLIGDKVGFFGTQIEFGWTCF